MLVEVWNKFGGWNIVYQRGRGVDYFSDPERGVCEFIMLDWQTILINVKKVVFMKTIEFKYMKSWRDF